MEPYRYQKYIDYISSAGPQLTKSQFDEDWEPIGPMIRSRLESDNRIRYEQNIIHLKWIPKGRIIE